MKLERYLKVADPGRGGWSLPGVRADLANLVEIAANSGDYDIQLRKNYFNIYYQGSSLAKVSLEESDGTYTASIHWKFFHGKSRLSDTMDTEHEDQSKGSRKGEKRKELKEKMLAHPHRPSGKGDNRYEVFTKIRRKDSVGDGLMFHQFFQKMSLDMIASNIRSNGGREEERMLEQVLIADNPPSKDFIIIDRQVSLGKEEEKGAKKMDMLSLRRAQNGLYRFTIIEVKLGNNPELVADMKDEAKVVKQLTKYVGRVQREIGEFAECYEENYRQKVELRLIDPESMPKTVKINRDPETVQGLVVVIGNSRLAEKRIDKLDRLLKAKGLRPVCQIRNEPKLAAIC